jgi:hypothetical protein
MLMIRTKQIAKVILSASISTLAALENYFDFPIMLPKLDMVAVPNMLLAGSNLL